MPNPIHFYDPRHDYGCFSNFSRHPFVLRGQTWPTSEHYFQAQKFDDPIQRESIRQARTPRLAADMGRDRSKPIRQDWESVKDSVMYDALQAKFTQHPEILAILIATGDAVLVEHTENDKYWGDGGDGSGKNMLGQLLMRLRTELRASETAPLNN